jgi:hypothetical protein
MFKRLFTTIAFAFPVFLASAQDKGQFSGDFTLNASAYDRDSVIGTNTTQYFHQKSSAESWLALNYRVDGFTFMVRYDLFNNSPLLNPQEAYTHQGLAFYSVSKKIDKLTLTVGSFYDQFGSGILFRSYEDRLIGIDYAVQGVRVQYDPNDSFRIKAFTGLQKYRFDVRPQVIKGADAEKVWGIGNLGFNTGLGFINRTLDEATMSQLADYINNLPQNQRFIPTYNMYAASLYNTLTYKNLSLYTEYARKSKEAVFITDEFTGNQTLENKNGYVFYGALNYSISGLGIDLQYKKINTFIMRASPFNTLLDGVLNFLPPLSKQLSYRLPARYSISALAQGETGYSGEVTYSPDKHNTIDFNTSFINQPNGSQLYREYYVDYNRKFNKQFKALIGIQSLIYDQAIYEFEPKVPNVHTITPFLEWSYRFNRSPKKIDDNPDHDKIRSQPSLRMELQYLKTDQDKGDFAYGLVELNFAPKYSFSVSDMINVKPVDGSEPVHYYSIFAAYTEGRTRFTLGYAKQVEGVVCTGGVCRVEPAFSGLRFGISTNF